MQNSKADKNCGIGPVFKVFCDTVCMGMWVYACMNSRMHLCMSAHIYMSVHDCMHMCTIPSLLLFSWLAHHSMLATCLWLEYCRAWFSELSFSRINESTTGYTFTLCGIVYFPVLRITALTVLPQLMKRLTLDLFLGVGAEEGEVRVLPVVLLRFHKTCAENKIMVLLLFSNSFGPHSVHKRTLI